jgi:hypothetical protein
MRRNIIISGVWIISAALIFSGCASSSKKIEINYSNNQANNSAITNTNQSQNNPADNEPGSNINNGQEDLNSSSAPQNNSPVKNTENINTSINNSVDSSKIKIINRLVSWGFTPSAERLIDTIIIHSSYNAVGSDPHSVDDIINKEYKPNGVSPHYIIGRDGTIYRLVEDKNIAYHAGESKLSDGRTNVNNFSIGIEVVETKSESPSAAEYAALKNLISYLKGKYNIKHVLGHSDIAPGRKDDPWNFDWKKI